MQIPPGTEQYTGTDHGVLQCRAEFGGIEAAPGSVRLAAGRNAPQVGICDAQPAAVRVLEKGTASCYNENTCVAERRLESDFMYKLPTNCILLHFLWLQLKLS